MFGLGTSFPLFTVNNYTARIHRHPDVDWALIPHRRIQGFDLCG